MGEGCGGVFFLRKRNSEQLFSFTNFRYFFVKKMGILSKNIAFPS